MNTCTKKSGPKPDSGISPAFKARLSQYSYEIRYGQAHMKVESEMISNMRGVA